MSLNYSSNHQYSCVPNTADKTLLISPTHSQLVKLTLGNTVNCVMNLSHRRANSAALINLNLEYCNSLHTNERLFTVRT